MNKELIINLKENKRIFIYNKEIINTINILIKDILK